MSKILLTGATGYIGGTILSQLLANLPPHLTSHPISLLVRTESQAQTLRSEYGPRIRTILWPSGLSDPSFIAATAENYDIVLNASSGFVPSGSQAFVDGLARRAHQDDDDDDHPVPWMIHTSGCTNLVDPTRAPREWEDGEDGEAVFEYMKGLDASEPYAQRTAEIAVLEGAVRAGVRAVSVQAPCVFGEGAGLFNRQALVIPLVLRYVMQHGHGFKLNEVANFDWVHVADLADFYVLIVRMILERADRGVGYIPSGRKGILFPTVGRTLVTEINRKAVDVAFAAGVLPRSDTTKEKEVRLVPLQEIADELTAGQRDIAQRGWGGEKAVKGTIGRRLLGWNPTRLEEAWNQDFEDELVALREGRRGITIESCIAASRKTP